MRLDSNETAWDTDQVSKLWHKFVSNRGFIMSRWLRKIIVKLRMSYADIRGHHGKRWNYEPGDHYMGRRKRK